MSLTSRIAVPATLVALAFGWNAFAGVALSLTSPLAVQINTSATFNVGDAFPNKTVHYFFTLHGMGSGPCTPSGTCLDLEPPLIHLTRTADANGDSSLTAVPPATLLGREICLQTAATSGGQVRTSDVWCGTIMLEGDAAEHGGHVYVFTQTVTDYNTAAAMCADSSMQVVVPNDADENIFLRDTQFAFGYLVNPWLGIDDMDVEGEWRTIDDALQTYFDWAPGEPNDAGGEDCVEQYTDYIWNDIGCSDGNQVVCEEL